MIGLKRGTVKLVKYNLAWQTSFKREERKILKIAGKDIIDIQHVGSTAIPGILAKPIIDIVVIFPSLKKARGYIRDFENIGYQLKKNDRKKKYRLFFTKGPEEKRTHYLHVGAAGAPYLEDMILFRDCLLEHKKIAREYSKLKKKLAGKYQGRREIYTEKKEKFIRRVVERAKKHIRQGLFNNGKSDN